MSDTPGGEIATADRPDLQRRWMEAYRRAEVELWEQKLWEVHRLTGPTAWAKTEGLLSWSATRPRRTTTSGLLERQQRLQRLAR